jgi:hypothetical protein
VGLKESTRYNKTKREFQERIDPVAFAGLGMTADLIGYYVYGSLPLTCRPLPNSSRIIARILQNRIGKINWGLLKRRLLRIWHKMTADPSSGEVVKSMTKGLAAVLFTLDPVGLIAPTTTAKKQKLRF